MDKALLEGKMNQSNWVVVDRVMGEIQGELLSGLLKAQGIEVTLFQEAASRAIGISLPPFGEVLIMVPESQQARAKSLLDDYYAGKLIDQGSEGEGQNR